MTTNRELASNIREVLLEQCAGLRRRELLLPEVQRAVLRVHVGVRHQGLREHRRREVHALLHLTISFRVLGLGLGV